MFPPPFSSCASALLYTQSLFPSISLLSPLRLLPASKSPASGRLQLRRTHPLLRRRVVLLRDTDTYHQPPPPSSHKKRIKLFGRINIREKSDENRTRLAGAMFVVRSRLPVFCLSTFLNACICTYEEILDNGSSIIPRVLEVFAWLHSPRPQIPLPPPLQELKFSHNSCCI